MKVEDISRELARSRPPPGQSPGGRVVAINRFYWPDESATAQFLTDLAERVAAAGREVVVITSRQAYDDPGAVLRRQELRRGVRIIRISTSRFGRDGLFGRAIDYLTFYLAAIIVLLREVRPGTTILAKTDPPLISVVAWLVARLKGAALVNWCQDLYPETAAALGLDWAAGPVGRALACLRDASLRGATVSVALCEPMAAHLRRRGVPAERIVVIPNWADGGLIQPIPPEQNPLRREWGLEGRRVIGYSGNLGRAHNLPAVREFITAMAASDPELFFLFIGAGMGALRAQVAACGLEGRVQFQPHQPRERLAQSLSLPDAHLVSLAPACEGLIMPSKLYGVLAAGRPVITLGDPDGAVAHEVRRLDAGLVWQLGAEHQVLALLDRAWNPGRINSIRAAFDAEFDALSALAAWTKILSSAPGHLVASRRLAAAKLGG